MLPLLLLLHKWTTFTTTIGYVPAYGSNGNSRSVSCSKPSLHCRKRPCEGALHKWLTRSASVALHMALYKWTTFATTTTSTITSKPLTVEYLNNIKVTPVTRTCCFKERAPAETRRLDSIVTWISLTCYKQKTARNNSTLFFAYYLLGGGS